MIRKVKYFLFFQAPCSTRTRRSVMCKSRRRVKTWVYSEWHLISLASVIGHGHWLILCSVRAIITDRSWSGEIVWEVTGRLKWTMLLRFTIIPRRSRKFIWGGARATKSFTRTCTATLRQRRWRIKNSCKMSCDISPSLSCKGIFRSATQTLTLKFRIWWSSLPLSRAMRSKYRTNRRYIYFRSTVEKWLGWFVEVILVSSHILLSQKKMRKLKMHHKPLLLTKAQTMRMIIYSPVRRYRNKMKLKIYTMDYYQNTSKWTL